MSVTYTTAADRDRHRHQNAAWLEWSEPLLAAASLVAALAIALACLGRLRVADAAERGTAATVVNLNTARDPAALEPALAAVFSSPADRRFAADELFRSLGTDGDNRQVLPNVGAISRLTVGAEAIERSKGLEVYAERLKAERARRAAASVPLFTVADLAKLKPFLTVRTREEFQRQVWVFSALYLAGFHLLVFLWSRRRVRGDRILLAAAHLLTGIGFAVLLSRPDPLRDSLLFVRYAETIAPASGMMAALSLVDIAALGFAALSYLPLLAALSLSVLLILFGNRTGQQLRQGQPRSVPADRRRFGCCWPCSSPATSRGDGNCCARFAATTIRDVRLPRWLDVPRGDYVAAGARRRRRRAACSSSFRRTSARRCSCAASFSRSTPSRAAASAWPPPVSVLLALGFYAGYRLQRLGDARRARAHVAVAVGQRGCRRQPDRPRDLGDGERRNVRHRAWSRRLTLSARRPHGSHPRRHRRRARRARPDRRRVDVRGGRVARIPDRAGWRRATTGSSSRPRSRCS